MKKSMKKMVAVAVAGVMVVAAAVPSFAAIISTEQGGRTNYIKTDNYKKYENYPCWIWYQGYCYYYARSMEIRFTMVPVTIRCILRITMVKVMMRFGA